MMKGGVYCMCVLLSGQFRARRIVVEYFYP